MDYDFYDFYKLFYNLNNYSKKDLEKHYKSFGKINNHLKNIKDFFDRYNDFNLRYYKMCNNDLNEFNELELIKHFHNYGRNENRIYNKKIFFNKFSDFNIDNYKNCNIDLSNFNEDQLIEHYIKYGQYEKRIYNKRTFFEKYNDFNLEHYRNFNEDLINFNDDQLIEHFVKYGHCEDRCFNERTFYSKNPSFNLEIYKIANPEFFEIPDIELLFHFEKWGKNENRIYNQEMFSNSSLSEIYRDFDLTYYREFNFPSFSREQLYYHYLKIGFDANKRYFNYDFDSDINPMNQEQNFAINSLTRVIGNYDDVVVKFNESGKQFFIYNEKSFYEYYDDFDLNFYRSKYGIEGSDLDVMLHYHRVGYKNKYECNSKTNIVILTINWDDKCGGLMVLHNMAKIINDLNGQYYVKIFNIFNLKYRNKFCNNFAKVDEITENTVVIYPECISKNPLNANKIVRWVLLDLGIEYPLKHCLNYRNEDLIYFWEKQQYYNNQQINNPFYKKLTRHWFNPIFKRTNFGERTKTCFLIKKAHLIHGEKINWFHNPDSIEINGNFQNLEEICCIFNECKYFYCYDPSTAFIFFARFCGCIPVLYPIEGKSKMDYIMEKPFYLDGQYDVMSIAYGNSASELENSQKFIDIDYSVCLKILEDIEMKTVYSFLEDLGRYNENTNTVFNYFRERIKDQNLLARLLIRNIDFNLEYYRKYNLDLENFSDNDLLIHFTQTGINQDRIYNENRLKEKMYSIGIDYNYYRSFNADLQSFDDWFLVNHFYDYGFYEERVFSDESFYRMYPNFDARYYREMNKDLGRFSDFDLKKHYHFYGRNENRKVNPNFIVDPGFLDLQYYKSFNRDIETFNDNMLIEHFLKYGKNENRIHNRETFNKKYPEFDRWYCENRLTLVKGMSKLEARIYYSNI